MSHPLYVAFVWHMHQPYYKASRTGEFLLPWVRMHALKDYADMVDILDEFPGVQQTFNLVPSLAEQLQEYASGDFRETHWDHTMKPAAELDEQERAFVVDLMCEPSRHPRARNHPRYLELALKKEACLGQGITRCAATFSVDELRDLQVWFNLAWFDPLYLSQEPLAGLVTKRRGYSEEDKAVMASVQTELLARTLPTYLEAERAGQIEVTTSPYFHPILPLLVNTDLARVARGETRLPSRRFAHPEDAAEQVERGIEAHKRLFGAPPQGVWCSEMGIGEDVITLLADHGIRWTIGDEEHLARSLTRPLTRSEAGHLQDPDLLYRAYLLPREGRELAVIFRDHALSDLVGFTYQSWAPRDAAANLIWRLREARGALAGSPHPHLVTIALDGENAWEYYEQDGRDFLRFLYEGLQGDPGFSCLRVADFLEQHPPESELPWLHTGSWIFADFSTWIGDPAHGSAWDELHAARDTVASKRSLTGRTSDPALEEAWHHILVAEGSDWFWWFSEHQESDIDHLWDLNFRRQLQEAYRLAGELPPLSLYAPLLTAAPGPLGREPVSRFSPRIDGLLSPADEWEPAGLCRAPSGGTMQRAGRHLLEELRFGADEHNLYLLLVPSQGGFTPGTQLAVYVGGQGTEPGAELPLGNEQEGLAAVNGQQPGGGHTRFWGASLGQGALSFEIGREILVTVTAEGEVTGTVSRQEAGGWGPASPLQELAYKEVVELALPLADLGVARGSYLELVAAVGREGVLLELCPSRGSARFVPAALPGRGLAGTAP